MRKGNSKKKKKNAELRVCSVIIVSQNQAAILTGKGNAEIKKQIQYEIKKTIAKFRRINIIGQNPSTSKKIHGIKARRNDRNGNCRADVSN